MSRNSPPPVLAFLLLPLLLLRAASESSDMSCSVKSCAALDVSLLAEYVSSLNVSWSTANDTTTPESAELQPFGALPSDWSRLLLLQQGQPEGTPLRDNLLRLSRLMLAAYFASEDRLGDDHWKIQPETNELQQGETTSRSNPAESGLQDQQAGNITLSSTAQKESTWINASSTYHNEEERQQQQQQQQPTDENLAGKETVVTTVAPYYSEGSFATTTTPQTADFNETFSSADNEPSGTKSNETLPDNEDESDSGAESSGPSSIQPPSDELTEKTSSLASNEAIHVASKEEFLLGQHRAKGENQQNDESRPKEEAPGNRVESAQEENKPNESSVKSSEERKNFISELDYNNNNNGTLSEDEASLSSEFNSTKSIEEFFEHEDDYLSKQSRTDESAEQALLTKSVEEFFEHEEQAKVNEVESRTINGSISDNSTEVWSESDEAFIAAMEEANGTSQESGLLSKSVEDFFKESQETNNDIMKKVTESASAVLEAEGEGEDKSNETLLESLSKLENSSSSESSTTDYETPVAATSESASSSSQESSRTPMTSEIPSSAAPISKNDSLDSAELISTERQPAAGSSSAGGKNEDNPSPTTLVELISGRFSTGIPSAHSNEIMLESTRTTSSPPVNGTEDRSEKYRDTTAAAALITSSLAGNTMLQVEDELNLASTQPAIELESAELEARTTDHLFSGSMTEWPAEDNRNPTTESLADGDLAFYKTPVPAVRQARKILLTFEDEEEEEEEGAIVPNVLREPEAPSRRRYDDTWELKEGAFNPAVASLRNQWLLEKPRRAGGAGIAAAGMNKRKSRERIAAREPALDLEKQYRTFFSGEPKRTQFAEKRSEEVQAARSQAEH